MNLIEHKKIYTPLPSAFQLVDIPIHYMHARMDSSHPSGDSPNIVKHFAAWFAGGFAVYSIAVCSTPVTIVADMVAGVAECAFCAFKGYSFSDIASLAKKKILVSPLHQLIFLAHAIVIPILISPLLTIQQRRSAVPTSGEVITTVAAYILFTWPLMYMFTQSFINDLSPEWNHRQFNIFYDKGARFGHFGRMIREDEFENSYNNYIRGRSYTTLKEFIENNATGLTNEFDPNQSADYNALKSFILRRSTPQDFLLNPIANEFSKAKYYKWVLAVNSNNNPAHNAEAAILLKCLHVARRQIQPLGKS